MSIRDDYRYALRRLFESCGSRFVVVEFLKKDGTFRTMLIQHAATKKHVKGDKASPSAAQGAATRAANHPELFNTYDVDRRAIRSINLDTIITIRSLGRTLYAAPQRAVEAMFSKEAA